REAYHTYDPIAVEQAKVLLYETLEESPNNPRVLGWLATLYVHTRNVGRGNTSSLTTADRIASKAIALGPALSEGYYAKGYAEAWLHGARAAIPWFRRALERERSPESLLLAYNMAEAGVALNDVVTLADECVARD